MKPIQCAKGQLHWHLYLLSISPIRTVLIANLNLGPLLQELTAKPHHLPIGFGAVLSGDQPRVLEAPQSSDFQSNSAVLCLTSVPLSAIFFPRLPTPPA